MVDTNPSLLAVQAYKDEFVAKAIVQQSGSMLPWHIPDFLMSTMWETDMLSMVKNCWILIRNT